jgi:hypothetical protein
LLGTLRDRREYDEVDSEAVIEERERLEDAAEMEADDVSSGSELGLSGAARFLPFVSGEGPLISRLPCICMFVF